MRQLKNASARVHIDRLEALRSQMAHHAEALAGKSDRRLTELLKDIYPDARERTAWEVQKKNGFDPFSKMPEAAVERILKKPWVSDGLTFSDRIWRDKEKLLHVLQGELTQGLIRGEAYDKIAKRIAHKMEVAQSAAARLVETEAAFFSSKGQLDAFRELGVERYEFVATLDARTSERCREMDGKVLALSEFKPGITAPPLHSRCRSTTCPYFDDEFTEGETRAARDPETGKTVQVDAQFTYEEWKDVFVDKVKTYARWRRDNLFKQGILQDITTVYIDNEDKVAGHLSIPPKELYNEKSHCDEIRIGSLLHRLFGGNMELLVESRAYGVKTPDFLWDGLFWDLKIISTVNAAHNALRKGLWQITEKKGGIILWLKDSNIDINDVITVVADRLYRSATADVTVILGYGEHVRTVLRYTKKK